MRLLPLAMIMALFLIPSSATAQDAAIKSAMSAAPASVSANATIVDWEMNVLRAGSNGWA